MLVSMVVLGSLIRFWLSAPPPAQIAIFAGNSSLNWVRSLVTVRDGYAALKDRATTS